MREIQAREPVQMNGGRPYMTPSIQNKSATSCKASIIPHPNTTGSQGPSQKARGWGGGSRRVKLVLHPIVPCTHTCKSQLCQRAAS